MVFSSAYISFSLRSLLCNFRRYQISVALRVFVVVMWQIFCRMKLFQWCNCYKNKNLLPLEWSLQKLMEFLVLPQMPSSSKVKKCRLALQQLKVCMSRQSGVRSFLFQSFFKQQKVLIYPTFSNLTFTFRFIEHSSNSTTRPSQNFALCPQKK